MELLIRERHLYASKLDFTRYVIAEIVGARFEVVTLEFDFF